MLEKNKIKKNKFIIIRKLDKQKQLFYHYFLI